MGEGSSPRGRGKPVDQSGSPSRQGLIPAWAGKTSCIRYQALQSTAHPRVGGENPSCRPSYPRRSGSSPRGRGKRWPGCAESRTSGLIPAWAGKTTDLAISPHKPGAHPRVGGENQLIDEIVRSDQGSSPRGRGKRDNDVSGRRQTRLIPAWAGKTHEHAATKPCAWAHPRVGGENFQSETMFADGIGSSPRGRGKHRDWCRPLRGCGLIPAWAGKTLGFDASHAIAAAHPRVGGENERGRSQLSTQSGSSPRGRGKRAGPFSA